MDALKQQIRHAWDDGADGYDDRWGHGIKTPAEQRAWTSLLTRLLPEPGMRVLDVGCGPGVLSVLAASLGHHVTGLDLAPRMLDVARLRARQRGVELTLVEGDAETPELPEASFDAVLSRHVLWTLPEPERAVTAWARLLRPGQPVLAIDGLWSAGGWAGRAQTRAGQLLASARRSAPEAEHGYPHEAYDLLPLRDVTTTRPASNAFRRAGLVDVCDEELDGIDRIERAAMPLEHRLQSHYRRYLVTGHRPRTTAASSTPRAAGVSTDNLLRRSTTS